MKKLIVVGMLVAMPAYAEFKDGNKLLSEMNDANIVDDMASLGYVMGVTDAGQGVLHCAPPNVRAGQLRDMVKQYLTDNPSIRHLAGDSIVTHVMKSTWPCTSSKRNRL